VARAVAARDGRFRVVAAPREGIVAALNRGLAHCRGRAVARMDADDLMHRERLAAQLDHLEAGALSAVGCHLRLFPRRGLGAGMRAYERWLNAIDSTERVRAEAFVECPVSHPTLMIRRALLAEQGYRDTGWPEDYDLLLRLLEAGHAVDVVTRRLLSKRTGPANLCRTHPVYGDDRFTACRAEFLARSFLAGGDDYVLWGYGKTGRTLQRALAERGKRPVAIVELHPGRIGNVIAGAPVVHPDDLARWRAHPLVVSVAGATARGQIRLALSARGYRERRDFVCAA
jgi:glycosyltransferase involved in cell wall biosynthesis